MEEELQSQAAEIEANDDILLGVKKQLKKVQAKLARVQTDKVSLQQQLTSVSTQQQSLNTKTSASAPASSIPNLNAASATSPNTSGNAPHVFAAFSPGTMVQTGHEGSHSSASGQSHTAPSSSGSASPTEAGTGVKDPSLSTSAALLSPTKIRVNKMAGTKRPRPEDQVFGMGSEGRSPVRHCPEGRNSSPSKPGLGTGTLLGPKRTNVSASDQVVTPGRPKPTGAGEDKNASATDPSKGSGKPVSSFSTSGFGAAGGRADVSFLRQQLLRSQRPGGGMSR